MPLPKRTCNADDVFAGLVWMLAKRLDGLLEIDVSEMRGVRANVEAHFEERPAAIPSEPPRVFLVIEAKEPPADEPEPERNRVLLPR